MRACELYTPSTPIPGVGLGRLMPPTESKALGGLPLTLAYFCDFRKHGPRMRLDDLPTPSRTFVACVSASTATVNSSPGRGGVPRTADYDFGWVFAVATVANKDSAEAPASPTSVAQPAPSRSSVKGPDPGEPTAPTAPVCIWPGSPAPQTMTPFSNRIFTRARRRSATAASKAPPTADYGFEPIGVPRPTSTRVTTPPRARRPPPAPPASAIATLADPPARTVSLQSDHDHAEPIRTPLLRLTTSPGDTPSTLTRSDALDDAAELRLADFVARYSHADWKREEHAESTCHATIRYIFIAPAVVPATRFLRMLPLAQASLPLRHPGAGG